MNQIIKIGIVVAGLSVASFVSAQEPADTSSGAVTRLETRAETIEDRQIKIDERLDARAGRIDDRQATRTLKMDERTIKMGERKEDFEARKAGLSVKQMERVTKFAAQMTKVHQAAVDRLTKLADRIDSRIIKIEAEKGVKLDASKAKLADARTKIASAQTYVNGISAQVSTITAAGTPQTALESVRGLFATSRENLKVAHQALVEVISSMKIGLGLNATTTTTN